MGGYQNDLPLSPPDFAKREFMGEVLFSPQHPSASGNHAVVQQMPDLSAEETHCIGVVNVRSEGPQS